MMESKKIAIPDSVFTSGLSLGAIGLLTMAILNEGFKKEELREKSCIGSYKFNKLFKELQDKGFIKTTRSNDSGRYSYTHKINL